MEVDPYLPGAAVAPHRCTSTDLANNRWPD